MGKPHNVSWIRNRNGEYRVGRSYVKNVDHQPMSDERRQAIKDKVEWKKRKSKNSRNGWYWYHGTARTYCLNRAQRCLRRWFQARLRAEDYDNIPTCDPKTMFYEPWDWD